MKGGDWVKKIGEGRTAEIYALDEHKIAKVFRHDIPDDNIRYELEMSERVESLGLKVPRVYGIEEVEGRPAVMYERINGESLLSYLINHPDQVRQIAQTMAELHWDIHSKSGQGLPPFKGSLKRNIDQVTELDHEEKEKVIAHLE